jgi:hypothetical protein
MQPLDTDRLKWFNAVVKDGQPFFSPRKVPSKPTCAFVYFAQDQGFEIGWDDHQMALARIKVAIWEPADVRKVIKKFRGDGVGLPRPQDRKFILCGCTDNMARTGDGGISFYVVSPPVFNKIPLETFVEEMLEK